MKIKGKSLMIRVTGKTIALATSCSLNTTSQFTTEGTKDDAEGPHAEFDYMDWVLSSNNVVGCNDDVTAEILYDELLTLQENGTTFEIEVTLVKDASGAIPAGGWVADTQSSKVFSPRKGDAFIDSINLDAPKEGNATLSVSFKAASKLSKISA